MKRENGMTHRSAKEEDFDRIELNMREFNRDAMAFLRGRRLYSCRGYMEMKP